MSHLNWNEIYTSTSPKLLGICRRYIKDIATAEDIVQDSFIVAIQKENSLKDAGALNGWLSRIVINMAIHHLKETKKINFSTAENHEIVDAATLMNTLETDAKSRILASDIDRNDILEAIDSLPEHHKSVFNLYVIDQFSHYEIARTLAIPVGTSKSSLSRARKAVQVFLLEKLNGKPVDEKKKRRMAFLLFLGFGNQMFARFYKKRFRDFEIRPEKTFETASPNRRISDYFGGLPKASGSKNIVVGAGLISIIGIGFLAYDFSPVNALPEKQGKLNISSSQDTVENPVINEKDPAEKEKSAREANKAKIIPVPEKTVGSKSKPQKTPEKPISATPEDSAKSEPRKVVVIKKQIVKKDTVYVTK